MVGEESSGPVHEAKDTGRRVYSFHCLMHTSNTMQCDSPFVPEFAPFNVE